jgi:PAS domain S-box-containing protein
VKPGCTKEELLHHQKDSGNLSDDIHQYCAALYAAIADGRILSTMENTANGRTVHTVSRPMPNGGWVTTHEDVTDRISAQRERDRNRDLLNLIVENVPVTIFVKNAADRRFILVNRACENTWGLPRSEIIGKTASDIFPQRSADEINDGDKRLLKGSDPLYFNEHALEMPRKGVRFIKAICCSEHRLRKSIPRRRCRRRNGAQNGRRAASAGAKNGDHRQFDRRLGA